MKFFHTTVAPEAIERVTRVLQSGFLNEGDVVREFERGLHEVLGLAHPVAVNSGTSALHLALAIAGIGPGDEVIVPAQTFVATGLVVLHQGARPVFADVDPATGNLAVDDLGRRLTPHTRAIVPVHWGGLPCDLQEIADFASGHGLVVIEDAAHALGARYRGRPIGAVSRMTAFSFQAIKHLTTGDGGALACLTAEDGREATARRWFGIDRAQARMNDIGARQWDIRTLGYKYHMNNVAAALGLGNLEGFPARLARRGEIASLYRARLAGVAGLKLPTVPADREHAWWLFTLRVERRDDFARALAGRGVPTSVVDLGIDRNSIFAGSRGDLPRQREFDASQIALPLHEGLTAEDVDQVTDAVQRGW
jgi:perosamine synthetase